MDYGLNFVIYTSELEININAVRGTKSNYLSYITYGKHDFSNVPMVFRPMFGVDKLDNVLLF